MTAAVAGIEVESLRKSYAGNVALDGVTFEVRPGEVVGLLGPNGAGKTTCLRIIAGFVPPDAGRARVAGVEVVIDSVRARRRLGYLPEGAPLYPELRVVEYLAFRAQLKRLPRALRRAEMARVLAACGLEKVERRLVGQLSHGYRQRVGLADALLGAPPVLVLDEPLSGLDPNQVRQARAVLRAAAEGGQAVLLSTHQLADVAALCARVLVVKEGRLVAAGALDSLRAAARRTAIVLQLRGAADPGEASRLLGSVDGIVQVELAQHAVRDDPDALSSPAVTTRLRLLASSAGPELRERMAATVHRAGWALQELRVEQPALEDAFAELTGEAGGGGEA